MQVKLLRAIDGDGYTPIGSNHLVKPNVRILAAVNIIHRYLVLNLLDVFDAFITGPTGSETLDGDKSFGFDEFNSLYFYGGIIFFKLKEKVIL